MDGQKRFRALLRSTAQLSRRRTTRTTRTTHDTRQIGRENEYGGTGGEGSQLLGGLDLLGGLVAALGVSLFVSRGGQCDERVNNTMRSRLFRLTPLHSSTDAAFQPRRVLCVCCVCNVRECGRSRDPVPKRKRSRGESPPDIRWTVCSA
jgi:hypothetical protein